MAGKKNIKDLRPSRNSKFTQGYFDAYNPKKYDCECERPIIYRSSYELQYMIMCERNPRVVKWSSESKAIPYQTTNVSKNGNAYKKTRRYNIDFIVEYIDGTVDYVEVKPWSMTDGNKRINKNSPTYKKNRLKWVTAKRYVQQLNESIGKEKYRFVIVTEKSLGL